MKKSDDSEHRYDDIIGLPHPHPRRHPRMPSAARAAQFAPFAALTGHSEAVAEAARCTETKTELDENAKDALDARLRLLLDNADGCPNAAVTYFMPDKKKAGGAYVTATGSIKKIDEAARMLIMHNAVRIPLDDIVEITV